MSRNVLGFIFIFLYIYIYYESASVKLLKDKRSQFWMFSEQNFIRTINFDRLVGDG